jgi:hypothetical protein
MPCEGEVYIHVLQRTIADLAVTPIPFVGQQLPYNPKFVREGPDVPPNEDGSMGGGMGGVGSVYGPGPAAAAASVLIPASPGGVAGEYRDTRCKTRI